MTYGHSVKRVSEIGSKPFLLCLNGPPDSGKNTAKDGLIRACPSLWLPVSKALKETTHRFFDLQDNYFNSYERHKNKPMQEFEGMTPREAYIWMSEVVIKPKFGNQWFGRQFIKQAVDAFHKKSWVAGDIIITDVGFNDEFAELFRWAKPERIGLVRLRRDGYTFEHDSRSYITSAGIVQGLREINLQNVEGNIPLLHKNIQKIAGALVNGVDFKSLKIED